MLGVVYNTGPVRPSGRIELRHTWVVGGLRRRPVVCPLFFSFILSFSSLTVGSQWQRLAFLLLLLLRRNRQATIFEWRAAAV